LAAALVVCAVAAMASARSSAPTVQLRNTGKGRILVDSRGFTIYAFTLDRRNVNNCVHQQGCMAVWPAVRHLGGPLAGPGIKASLIGSITLKGGAKQLTYNGWPLYTYVGDTHAGQTSYVNILQFNGRWPALNAAGGWVK
jgi:predicted lipoprotein with Yx(FWY)xxD motif